MKTIYNYSCIVALLVTILLFCECKSEQSYPVIEKIHLVKLNHDDSAINSAELGDKIAIIGRNLGSTHTIYFDNRQANLNPVFITDNSIIVDIPYQAPTELTNKILLITADGQVNYDFSLDIPTPVFGRFRNEFTPVGEKLIIEGENFYGVSSIKFGEHSVDLESAEINAEEIVIRTREEYVGNKITIKTVKGEVSSVEAYKFVGQGLLHDFNDNSTNYNVYITAGAPITDKNTGGSSKDLDGKYLAMKKADIGAYSYYIADMMFNAYFKWEDYGISGDAAHYALKFEMNTVVPWPNGWMHIQFNFRYPDDPHTPKYGYMWQPYRTPGSTVITPFETDGWQTITIPLSNFKTYNANGMPSGTPIETIDNTIQNLQIAYANNTANPIPLIDMCLDNVRIVKIK